MSSSAARSTGGRVTEAAAQKTQSVFPCIAASISAVCDKLNPDVSGPCVPTAASAASGNRHTGTPFATEARHVEIDLQAGAQYKYKVVLMSCRMPQPACLRKCLQHV
ncbi:unnamed protein product [Urochloa humidicola]